MTSDPIRLLDDPSVSEALRADLGHASNAGVHGFDAAAGAASLRIALAAEAGAGAAAGGTSALAKIALATALIGGGAVAAWAATRAPEPAPPTHATVAKPEPIAQVPSTKAQEPGPQTPPSVEPVVLPKVEVEASPEAQAAIPEEPEAVPSERPRVAPRAAKKKTAPAPKAEDFAHEARIVADARRKLSATNGAKEALALLDDAKSEFPRGMLKEERQALRIMALAKLGRSEDARKHAKTFLRKHGRGPYADAVRRAVE